MVNPEIAVNAPLSHELQLDLWMASLQLGPVVVLAVLITVAAFASVQGLLVGFIAFGRTLDFAIRSVFWACAAEMFTKCFSNLGIPWPFDPLLGNPSAGLEIAGTIAIMLTGVYPFVYLLRTHCAGPLMFLGRKAGMDEVGATGAVASLCNTIAMFGIYKDMGPESKLLCSAFMVSGCFVFGDFLAYASVYQPGILPALICGKLTGAIISIPLAHATVLPIATRMCEDYKHLPNTAPDCIPSPSPSVRSLCPRRSIEQFMIENQSLRVVRSNMHLQAPWSL